MLTYQARIAHTTNPTAQRLYGLMADKTSNLCLAADVTSSGELLLLADMLGPYICVLKTHIDMIDDFSINLVTQLQRLAEKHAFLIFEDRKFGDIGNTVKYQYQEGIYHIADWAHIINAEVLPGPSVIDGLKEVGLHKGHGLLLQAEMSTNGSLAIGDYTAATVTMAEAHDDFVIGFMTQRRLSDNPKFLSFTSGVQFDHERDESDQHYRTPAQAIGKEENDIIIVGRGIYEAADPKKEAKKYREAGWRAYQERLNQSSYQ